MGKIKSFYSSTKWETSDFGGFSRILWDLPDMKIPTGFNISVKGTGYLSYYEQRKLLSLFLYKAHQAKLSKILISGARASKEEIKYPYYAYTLNTYTFSKEDVKTVLKHIIANEVELRSLFVHYSNYLANSTITYDPPRNLENLSTEELEEKKESILKSAISEIKEKKSTYSYQFLDIGEKIKELKDKTTFKTFAAENTPTTYSDYETTAADKLLELLDISFEKSESKISSLVSGKLDIPKIAEIVSGNTHIYYKKEILERTKPFSICILCDESGSMEGENFFAQHSLVKIMYKAFSSILPPEKIYVYGHSGEISPEIHIYQDKLNPNFELVIDKQKYVELEQNYDGPVTDIIYEKIRSYTDDNILFIVISDGEPAGYAYGSYEDQKDYKRVIEKCKRDGFVTCGIGINYFRVKDLYQYSTIINSQDIAGSIKNVTRLLNSVVKSEFQ